MNRAIFPLLCSAGICLAAMQARADLDQIQIANLTASGGVASVPYGPDDFPIASPVTFNNLVLTETFADSTVLTDTLYDSTNTAQTSLGAAPANFILTGNVFDTTAHGGLVSTTLTGETGPITVQVYLAPGFGASTGPANILPTFSGTLSGAVTGSYATFDLLGYNPGKPDTPYAAGTISLVAADVPEPGTLGLLSAAGVVSLLGLRRRRRA